MRRHNYAPSLVERRLGMLHDRSLPPHLRGSAAAVGAAVLAVALAAALELQRAGALETDLAVMNERSAATAQAAVRVAAVNGDVTRLRRIAAALELAQRGSTARLDDLARLGNRLPEQTWLTAVHSGRDGSWSIEGRSARVLEIGATLAGIQSLDAKAPVRLVSIAANGATARTLRFAIVWERRP